MNQPEAAVAILHAAKPSDSILLMRRSERDDDSWSGQWSFPGGRREDGDADLLDTALRELREECGVALGREHVETALDMATARRRSGPFLQVAPFVLRVEREIEAVPDQLEAVETCWLPLSLLRDPARHVLRPIPGIPPNMLFPSVSMPEPGMPLWGFTYRLIAEWLGLARDAGGVDTVLAILAGSGIEVNQDGGGCPAVNGPIPVERVVALLGEPWPRVPAVNAVEVRQEWIKVTDLSFREFLIAAV